MLSCFSGPRETQLTLPLLTAALKSLPCRFEISGAQGLRYSNRAPGPHDGISTTVVPVTKNVNLTYWSAPVPNNTLAPLESIDAIVWQAKLEGEGAAVAEFRGNQRWREFYGIDESVAAWFHALHPDHVSSAKAAWDTAIRNRTTFDHEHKALNAVTREYVWLSARAHPVRDSLGAVSSFVCFESNIQERKAAEELAASARLQAAAAQRDAEAAVAAEQRMLSTILEQLPIGAFVITPPNADLKLFNARARDIWGAKNAASTGDVEPYRASRTGYFPDGRMYERMDWPGLRSLYKGDIVKEEEIRMAFPDRDDVFIRVNSAPVRAGGSGSSGAAAAASDIIAAVVVMEDITDLRDREADRLRLLEEERGAKASSAAKSEFVANMSHELRTPIHGILGLSELLERSLRESRDGDGGSARDAGADLGQQQLQYCRTIRECAQLLQSLVSNVLDYSKMAADRMPLESLPIALPDLFRHTLDLLQTSAAEKGAQLSLVVAPGLPGMLCGDPLRLQQIVINLVSNGIKFCGGGDAGTTNGVVVVRVSVAPPAEDKTFAETSEPLPGSGSLTKRLLGDPTLNRRRSQAAAAAALAAPPQPPPAPSCRVLIEVEDNGPGVPADVAARLFAPFTQADSSTTRRYGGTGLGLSIVRGLAELMGGSANVRSPNALGGATFSCVVSLSMAPRQDSDSATTRVVEPLEVAAKSPACVVGTAASEPIPSPALLLPISNRPGGVRICAWNGGYCGPCLEDGRARMVVEDNRVNRLIAERFCRALGIAVDMAEDGRAGFDAVASAQPPYDLVFMDCQMPVWDGFEATRAIRRLSSPTRAQVPIVALSASTLPEEVSRCITAGMDAHIAKPVDSGALAAAIRRFTGVPKAVGVAPLPLAEVPLPQTVQQPQAPPLPANPRTVVADSLPTPHSYDHAAAIHSHPVATAALRDGGISPLVTAVMYTDAIAPVTEPPPTVAQSSIASALPRVVGSSVPSVFCGVVATSVPPVVLQVHTSAASAPSRIEPSTVSDIALFSPLALAHAGQPVPARPVGPSHDPAPKGAVWVAASTGDTLSLEEELQCGGSTEEADMSGVTAAGVAAARGQLDALKVLVGAGAELGQTEEGSLSPLHHAVLGGKVDVVNYLLTFSQVDPNVGEGMGATPLHYAARSGRADIVRALLVCSRVDPQAAQANGATALAIAEQRGHAEVVAILRAAPARPDLSQHSRRTRATFSTPSPGMSPPAALKGSSGGSIASSGLNATAEQRAASAVLDTPKEMPTLADIVPVRAAKPAAPARQKGPSHLPAPKGAVWVAASTGDVLSLEEELARGGSTEEADESGVTAAGAAAARGQLDALKALSLAGAELGQAENGSVSPLHHAVLGNRVEVVKYLLSLPAVDPNVGDGMGATPLHYAARSGFADIVRAFLACSRVDRHSSLGDGSTALAIAEKRGHKEVAALFKAASEC